MTALPIQYYQSAQVILWSRIFTKTHHINTNLQNLQSWSQLKSWIAFFFVQHRMLENHWMKLQTWLQLDKACSFFQLDDHYLYSLWRRLMSTIEKGDCMNFIWYSPIRLTLNHTHTQHEWNFRCKENCNRNKKKNL